MPLRFPENYSLLYFLGGSCGRVGIIRIGQRSLDDLIGQLRGCYLLLAMAHYSLQPIGVSAFARVIRVRHRVHYDLDVLCTRLHANHFLPSLAGMEQAVTELLAD